ncbi:MAG: AAA family ATPase [Phycisphaerales bacterium JB039]
MSADPPSVIVLAGPNGAGKSTAAPYLLRGRLRISEFVNADDIARGLSGFVPEISAITAGRIMLQRIAELSAERATFAFETTLASRSFAPRIASMRSASYRFRLIFLHLASADLAVVRVRARVQEGGHDVPVAVVRRRYARGLRNLFSLYLPLADEWAVYDNSGKEPAPIARNDGRISEPRLWNRLQTEYGA